MPKHERLGRDFRNCRQYLADVICKPQRNGQTVTEDAGVEVDLGQGKDVCNDLLDLRISEHDLDFQRGRNFAPGIGEEMGYVA